MTDILDRLQRTPIVPLVAPENPESGIRTTKALVDGGLTVIEVVLRTPAAVDCLDEIAQAVPEAIIGAGTVLTEKQAEAVILKGAQFIVLPGLYSPVVKMAQSAELPVFPGISTATEAQQAWNLGLSSVKFFPASLSGGIPMLKALSSVFQGMSFMPTGGITAENVSDFLALPSVLACGGSWLTPKFAIAEGDFQLITDLAAQAVSIGQKARID